MRRSGQSMLQPDVAVPAGALLGEGPVWDGQSVAWVDIDRGLLHRYDPAFDHDEAIEVGQQVGAVARRQSGGYIAAVRDGFAAVDFETGAVSLLAAVERDVPHTRMNDGKCDQAGRFWAGTMALGGPSGQGCLYRLDTDLSVRRMVASVTVSNGMDWSADGTTMFYIDSPTGGIDAFDFDLDSGRISGRRRVVTVDPPGIPDGMTLDGDGSFWVAMWEGGCVRRYLPDGRLDRVIDLPVQRVTSCCFGGDDLRTLYITSASVGLSDVQLRSQPHAGALFRCDLDGVAEGRPSKAFQG